MKTTRRSWLRLLQLIVLLSIIAAPASAQLQAGFSATPVTGCPPMVVSFQDTSKGSPVAWKWDLGNGTIAYIKNPVATYFTPGSYNIKLVVTNAAGTADSVVKSQYVIVNSLPVAKFGASDSTGCFPLNIQFNDSSVAVSGTITRWQWDFGDGTLSTDQNPSHTYTSAGNFTVILRVSNSNGCNGVYTKPAFITIRNGVKADFSATQLAGCSAPATVAFTNNTIGTGSISYLWDLGDGKKTTAINPTNNYPSGNFSVKLIATNSYGCADSITKVQTVQAGAMHADFLSSDTICAGNNLQFTNTSTPANFTASNWSFGNGNSSTQTNPSQLYGNAGVYTVKLVMSFGTCSDSISKSVTVLPAPTAAFTAANTTGCTGPLQVSFTSTSANAVSYQWDFGDGTTSTLQNPVHSYTAFGTYSVTLTVKNSGGCASTVVQNDLVKFRPLKIQSVNNLGVQGCLPITVSPTATIENNIPVSTYSWDFGDGSKATTAAPSHTYTAPGAYNVTLVVTTAEGCKDSLFYSQAVMAGNKPAVQFSATPRDVCASMPVYFTDNTTGAAADQWLWFFGDGGSSIQQSPKYTYTDTGFFKVTLIASSFGCIDTLALDKFIHVRPPIAGFDTSYVCSDPLTRKFINKSLGATSYDWNFGDGSASSLQNPTHTYAQPGTYTVVLIVSNNQCQSITKKDVVVVKEAGNLTMSDSITCLNTRIIFNIKNIDESNIGTYNWYFDGFKGGVITTVNNPVAWSFNTPGSRYSAVVLTDILKCNDTLYAPVAIKSYGPRAAFLSVKPNTCLGNTITFTDSTKTDGLHSITQYVWNYGDGSTQNYITAPFSHDYAATGNYDVKMIVTDSYGCKDSITKASYVSITKPVAGFTASDTALCPSLPITFTNTSKGVNAVYNWNFGDGTSSNAISPTHSFNQPGAYMVVLNMIDVNGCTAADSLMVKIYTAKAEFSMSDSFSTCPPLVVKLTNQSANYTSLNWDFGDGGNSQLTNPSHIYTYPGNYTVKLTVKNNGGCSDLLTKKVVIQGPTGTFDYVPKEACNPGTLNYRITAKNTVSYVWDFNDGNTVYSVDPTVSHTYLNAGVYLPKVILQDNFGCKVAVQGLDTVKIHAIKTNILSDTKVLCDSGYVNFADSTISDDVVNNFLWNFGDGQTSTVRNPSHHFSNGGVYSVKLISTTAFGCKDTAIVQNYIKIVSSPAIKMMGDTSACEPGSLQLTADFVQPDSSAVTWVWNFGNGANSNLQKPDTQTYAHSGSYSITVKATNSNGCISAVSKTAVIFPKPVIDAGPDAIICKANTYNLTATGGSNYNWLPNPSLSCTNCANPQVKPVVTATYYVTGKSTFGCSNQDSVTVKVQQPFKMTVSKPDTICKGATVSLKASGTDVYQWSPSLWLNNTTSSSPVAKPDTTITYQVVGSDANSCFKDTQSVRIKVFPLPVVQIINGPNLSLQVGSNLQLTTKNSADVINWKWFPSQWLSCASCSNPIAAPKETVTYSVTATNGGNCTAQDKVTINLICNEANVFIPNTFSPNGDGVNDVFYPRGTGLFNILSFKVFNRWGQVVFEKNGVGANNPADGWDGTANGLPLQPDVYVYIINVVCSNNVIFPFKGNVSLIR